MRARVIAISAFVFIAGLGLLAAGRAWADVAVTPAYVEVSLDKGRPGGVFTITNQGEKEERYRVQSLHFTFSKTGGLDRLTPDENSLATWIQFYPKEFTIQGKATQKVRFTIVPKGRLRPGEYWAGMELESLDTRTASSKDGGGREMKITIISTVLVPIFGQYGEVTHDAEVKETLLTWQDGAPAAQATIVNKGSGRLLVTGKYEIVNAAGEVVGNGGLGRAYVMPGLERQFTTTLEKPIPNGKYTLRVTYDVPQLKAPLKTEATIDWNSTPPPAAPPAEPPAKTGSPAPGAAAPK